MPTKLDIYTSEQSNTGKIILYPEGMFYKAYDRSAYLLCTYVYPFKVSARPLKGIEGPLVSVGFPFSSLEKFAKDFVVDNTQNGILTLCFTSTVADFSGFEEWKSQFITAASPVPSLQPYPRDSVAVTSPIRDSDIATEKFDTIPLYNLGYHLLMELCIICAKMQRDYKYSLGEELRMASMRMMVCISEALKSKSDRSLRLDLICEACEKLCEVKLCLRLLNDLRILSDRRYVDFIDTAEQISKQLYLWKKSEKTSKPE